MNRRYQRDVNNLSEYYTELTNEMKKALKRPGLSAELMAERQEKIDLIPDEMTKKKEDLFKKYSIRVNLRLSSVMLIRTPAVKLFCRAEVGRRQKQFRACLKCSNPRECSRHRNLPVSLRGLV
jgi:hypothetical protein